MVDINMGTQNENIVIGDNIEEHLVSSPSEDFDDSCFDSGVKSKTAKDANPFKEVLDIIATFKRIMKIQELFEWQLE